MMIGFHETMYGEYWSLDPKAKSRSGKFDFTVDASARLGEFVNPAGHRFLRTHLEGIVTMEGLCDNAIVMDGTLGMFNGTELSYGLKFMTDRGLMHYRGKKFLSLRRPLKAMTTLYGKIEEDLRPEYKSHTLSLFRLTDLPAFMLSFVEGAKFE